MNSRIADIKSTGILKRLGWVAILLDDMNTQVVIPVL